MMLIFASVGTRLEPFDRLVAALDDAIDIAHVEVSGAIQLGATRRKSRHLENYESLTRVDFHQRIMEASVVVSHAGAGVLQSAIRAGHVPYVMARRRHCGEVVNDHQLEIASLLSERGLVRTFVDGHELAHLLREGPRQRATRGPPDMPLSLTQALRTPVPRQRRLLARAILHGAAAIAPPLTSLLVSRR